jgi:hypothetical protein
VETGGVEADSAAAAWARASKGLRSFLGFGSTTGV